LLGYPTRDPILSTTLNFERIIAEQTSNAEMSTPHPPTSSSGTVEQTEPAWNPGGRNLSYINKTGRRKFGVIGVLLSLSPIPPDPDPSGPRVGRQLLPRGFRLLFLAVAFVYYSCY